MYGDGVNVASRIESLGIPGSVLISGKLRLEVVNHPGISTKSLGWVNLKNVKEPVELFAITNEGLQVPKAGNLAHARKRSVWQLVLVAVVIAFAAYFTIDILRGRDPVKSSDALKTERIAVRFHDFVQMEEQKDISEMAALWISHRIRDLTNTQVAAFEQATRDPEFKVASAGPAKLNAFASRTGAVNLLEGFIFPIGDSLQFEATIYDLSDGKEQHRFAPVKCHRDEAMDGIGKMTQEIQGWWASREMPVLSTPDYDAFEAYLDARALWNEDNESAETLLFKSIELDSSFIDPHFLLLDLYYNEQRYQDRARRIELIKEQFPRLNARQSNLLAYHEADHAGDVIKTYELYRPEIQVDPKDVFINTSAIALAVTYVNNNEEVLDLFKEIPVDSLDLESCRYCNTRIELTIRALNNLKEYRQARQMAKRMPVLDEQVLMYSMFPAAKNGDNDEVDRLLDLAKEKKFPLGMLYSQTAREYALAGNTAALTALMSDIEVLNDSNLVSDVYLAQAYSVSGQYDKALGVREPMVEKYPRHQWVQSHGGLVHAAAGNTEAAMACLNRLDTIDELDPYDYGSILYDKALIHVALGNSDESLNLLSRAREKGHKYTFYNFRNDPVLEPLFEDPRFLRIINPVTGK